MERVASLRSEVLELQTVATPGEVLARLDAEAPYDLVVCDYRLRIEGRSTTSAELVRELVRRGQRVALMTGDIESIAPDLTGVAALQKPLRLDDLLDHLRGG